MTQRKKNVKPAEKIEYVLDTSVLVYEEGIIYNFKEHDITILTTVFDELDNMKTGTDAKAFLARELHRKLDELGEAEIPEPLKPGQKNSTNKPVKYVSALFNGGVSLGEGLGNIAIKHADVKLHEQVKKFFPAEKADHQILSAVFKMQNNAEGKKRVVLISKDTNLRLKAKVLNIAVQDYKKDKVPVSKLYSGNSEVDDISLAPIVDKLYKDGKANIFNDKNPSIMENMRTSLKPNMYFILKDGNRSVLARVDKDVELFHRVEKRMVSGISPRNAEQVFTVDAVYNPDVSLVALQGKAGTGKTLLAIATGVQMLKEEKYDVIVMSAAMVTVGNKEMGALPGSAIEKVAPFMSGLHINLNLIKKNVKGKKSVEPVVESKTAQKKRQKNGQEAKTTEREDNYIAMFQKEGKIEIQPLAYVRGSTFHNALIIVDECQNLTPHETKTIITRVGERSKIIICGDTHQIDTPYLDASSNGLSHVIHRMGGHKVMSYVKLFKGERSVLAELAADML